MEFEELITRLALALGVGLLIGVERGWQARDEESGSRTAGIRTFVITAVLGAIVAVVSQSVGGIGAAIVASAGFTVYAVVMAIFCLRENRARRIYSATTWITAMLTFALGACAIVGDMRATAAAAVAATLVLALRDPLHGWLENLTWPELRSAIVLLAMTFIALPVLPNETIGPVGGINPRDVWLIAIALAGASFAGYIAVKYLGASHGILLAGAAGGLASSTAVTIANARRAAAGEGSSRLLAAGVAAASMVMFLRVCVIVLVFNQSLLVMVGPPLVVAAVVSLIYALVAAYGNSAEAQSAPAAKFKNPFAFWSVIGIAVSLGLVIVAGRAISQWLGGGGAILGAAVVGLVDVDAVTVSLAQLTPQTLSRQHAMIAILVAVTSDTISKIAIGALIGRGSFALQIAVMAACALGAGALAWWATLAIAPTA